MEEILEEVPLEEVGILYLHSTIGGPTVRTVKLNGKKPETRRGTVC